MRKPERCKVTKSQPPPMQLLQQLGQPTTVLWSTSERLSPTDMGPLAPGLHVLAGVIKNMFSGPLKTNDIFDICHIIKYTLTSSNCYFIFKRLSLNLHFRITPRKLYFVLGKSFYGIWRICFYI